MYTKQFAQTDHGTQSTGRAAIRRGRLVVAGFAAAILPALALATVSSSLPTANASSPLPQATPGIVQVTNLAANESLDFMNISGDGKQVLYILDEEGTVNNGKLYLSASDGSGSHLIDTGLPDGSLARMNYDGSQVVWSDANALRVNGVDILPCYHHAGAPAGYEYHCLRADRGAEISGNGRNIFFVSGSSWDCKWDNSQTLWDCNLPAKSRLWRIPSGGGDPVIVLDLENSYGGLHLSSNSYQVDYTGTTIAFACDDGNRYGACVFQASLTRFIEFAGGFSLSPDGRWLVWEEGDSVHVNRLDSSQTLAFEFDGSLITDSRFMSDDAARFLYAYGNGLWLMNRDGSGRTQVVTLDTFAIAHSLSYSGQDIAFTSTDDLVGNGNSREQIFTRLGPPIPDLSVAPFSLEPGKTTLDNDRYILPVDVVVWNVGEASVSDVPVRFSDSSGWSTQRTITVGANVSTTLHLEWDITSSMVDGQGEAAVQLTVQADPDSTITEKTHLNNQHTASAVVDARPRIQVRPELALAASYFLDEPDIANRVRVLVDWNGDLAGNGAAGSVYFDLNGAQIKQDGQSWGAEHIYHMGSDFESNYLCANNTLRIFAVGPTGFNSLETVIQPTVFPAPVWWDWLKANLSGGSYSFSAQTQPPLVEYTYDYKYPPSPFVANWTPPAWVPYLGGKPLGILQTQASASTSSWSNGGGQTVQSGQTGFQVGSLGIMGQLSGSGETQFICGQSLNVESADVNLQINGLIEQEEGLVDLIPGLGAAEKLAIVGRYVRWLNRVARVKGQQMPGVGININYETRDGELEFNQGEGTAFVATKAILEITPFKALMMDVYGGGKPYLTIAVPANPDYLKTVGIQMYYGADLRVFCFQQTFEHAITCNYPGGCGNPGASSMLLAAEPRPAWQLIPRKAASPMQLRAGAVLQATATTTETTLSSPIYIYPQPALAVADSGSRILAYVDDDSNDPPGRSTEIHVQMWGGSSWSDSSLTDDQQPDFAPAVAFDGSGNGLALWEHSTLSPGITPTLDITFAQSLEIVARTWVSSSAAWGNVVTLTNDSLMDYAPLLSAGSDGTAMAIWQTNDGTDILGTAAHPVTLTCATWDGSSWGSPVPALSGLHDVLDVAFAAYSSTQAALVYVIDADGVLSTTGDSDLYYSVLDGSGWSAPTRMMTDTITDTTPALAYDAAGDLHLLWLRDGDLVWLKNSWASGAAQSVRTASTEAGFLGFTLSRAVNGNLSLVWQTMDGDGSNLAYSIYDAAHDSWGADQPLISDADLEGSHSPAFGSDGALYLAYQKIATRFITRTVSGASGTFTVTGVPTRGGNSLVFLEHTVGLDLAFDSLTITPTNPAPGQSLTLTAVLRNAGDLAVLGPQVAFYDGATPIVTRTLAITLAAGYTATARTGWTVPASAAPHTIRAVADPGGLVTENDENNNEITLQTVLPDLQVELLYTTHSSQTITATARLVNAGVLTATAPFSVAFRAADPLTGTLLGTAVVGSALGAGERVTTTLTLTSPATLAGLGDLLWATADAGGAVVEMNEGNNSNYARLAILPDLTITAADISAGDGPVVVTIHNIGVVTATAPVVAVRQGGPTGTLVYSGTLDTLAAGGSDAVTLSSVGGRIELWVYADPDRLVAESDESNNLAVRALKVPFRLYLPLVLRS